MENYVGKRLDGRYEIMEIIGVGGMAVVYKAFDNIDHRIVAVKILKQEYLTNEEFKRRFRNESKAIAVLSHPNIVKVFDVSFGDIIQYIVMEYVEGITLKQYIEQQKVVDTREALYFTTQILRALQHAHDKGIVHRDIKPQNIMLISDGTIKVTDFGIARFSQNETRTMTDGAIGSVHYISPEQAKGSITDNKTDIYSCGVMLYEMLTGTLPFQSDNAVSVALMQLQNDPVRPSEIISTIPTGIEEIIIKAMQKNQSARYQSASEMLTDLIAFKNNPSVVFGYEYESAPVAAEADIPVIIPQEPINVDPVEDNEYDEEEPEIDSKKKIKTIAMLGSVLAALVIFAIFLASVFFDSGNKVQVPDLIGLNFYTEVMYQSAYSDFNFEPVIDDESNEEAGTIINQTPRNGKVEVGSIITLYISGASSEIEVPDVYGYESSSAINLLKSKGFEVEVLQENSDKEVGTVVRTSPAKGELAELGETITVYVATNEEILPVDVPNLVGMTVAQAKQALSEVGLSLDSSRTEYRSSSEPVGRIIGHEHIGEQVAPGTSIAVYVSTGRPPESTTEETTVETTQATTQPQTTKPVTVTTQSATTNSATTTTKRTTTEPTVATTSQPSTAATTSDVQTTANTTKPAETTAKPVDTTAKPAETTAKSAETTANSDVNQDNG